MQGEPLKTKIEKNKKQDLAMHKLDLNAQSEANFKEQQAQRQVPASKIKQSEGVLSVTTLSNEEFRGGKRGANLMKAKYRSNIAGKTPKHVINTFVQRKESEPMLPTIPALRKDTTRERGSLSKRNDS